MPNFPLRVPEGGPDEKGNTITVSQDKNEVVVTLDHQYQGEHGLDKTQYVGRVKIKNATPSIKEVESAFDKVVHEVSLKFKGERYQKKIRSSIDKALEEVNKAYR